MSNIGHTEKLLAVSQAAKNLQDALDALPDDFIVDCKVVELGLVGQKRKPRIRVKVSRPREE